MSDDWNEKLVTEILRELQQDGMVEEGHAEGCHMVGHPAGDGSRFWPEVGKLYACGYGCAGCTCGQKGYLLTTRGKEYVETKFPDFVRDVARKLPS